MGQEAIARSIGLSRPYVSRLLTEAKEMGIIQFRIIDPLKGESDLERKLRAGTNLEKVVAAQLCGGISNLEHNIYCFEIVRNFARAWEAKPYLLTCPAVVSSRLKEAF